MKNGYEFQAQHVPPESPWRTVSQHRTERGARNAALKGAKKLPVGSAWRIQPIGNKVPEFTPLQVSECERQIKRMIALIDMDAKTEWVPTVTDLTIMASAYYVAWRLYNTAEEGEQSRNRHNLYMRAKRVRNAIVHRYGKHTAGHFGNDG